MGGKKQPVSTQAQQFATINLQTSCYGSCIPVVYGRNRVSPNLIYYNDFTAKANTTTTRTGKGGGGGNVGNTTYTYYATVILALCEGIASVGTAYHDKDVGTAASFGFTTFNGARPQTPWSYLNSKHPADAIAYSGTSIACQANMLLDDTASIGNYSFEVTASYSIANGTPGSPDSNAADYIPDFLSNVYYGASWDPTKIGDTTLLRSYVTAMGLWGSPVLDTQKTALEHLNDMVLGVNSDYFVDGLGVLQIQPYGDTPVVANGATFTPVTTPVYDFGPGDFIVENPSDKPVKVTRANHQDTFNTVPIEFSDRSNAYNTNTVWSTEPVDADIYGLRTDSTKTLHSITSQSIALTVSRILAQRSVYIRNQYEFNVGWKYVCVQPFDLITITEPLFKLARVVARVKRVKEDKKGNLTITAAEWPFGVAHATQFQTQSSDVSPLNSQVTPGNTSAPVIFDYPLYLSSTGGAAIGVAASGGANWGGCEVWMSSDNETYALQGRITGTSRYGVTTASYPAGTVYDTADTLAVDLSNSGGGVLSSTTASLNADFANMALVGNELVSFQTATLTAANKYNLTNVYRGILGTSEVAHSSGAAFVYVDDTILEVPITPARIGSTLYFKLISYNQFGKALQDLSTATVYTYVPSPSWSLPNASGNFSVNGTVNGIAFTWGQNLLPGSYVVELWEGTTATAYSGGTATKIWEGTATGKLIPKSDTTTRYYWIRPRAGDGRYGAVVPAGNGTPGAAALVTSAIVLSIAPGSATSSGTAQSQTTNSVAVTVTGGTAPYTYAWSWSAGGSGMAVNSPSASSTSFSTSGALSFHETRTGTAKCVVVDNLGQSQTVFVNVSISETATSVSASASPSSVGSSGIATSQTTGAASVSASGGLAPYTYAWSWQSGGTSLTITSASSSSTTFSASGLAAAETRSGTAQCVVTDAYGQTSTTTVSVSIGRAATVSAGVSPGSLSTSSTATTQTTGYATVSASGGSGSYTYAWSWVSGGTGLTITSASSSATAFSASGLSTGGETRSGTAQCVVTDGLGQTATVTVSVSIQCISSVQLVSAFYSSRTNQTVFTMSTDGHIYCPSTTQQYQWTGDTNTANYQAYATATSGALSTGTMGSWVSLGTVQTWSVSGAGDNYAAFNLQIRRASDGAVLASANIQLENIFEKGGGV